MSWTWQINTESLSPYFQHRGKAPCKGGAIFVRAGMVPFDRCADTLSAKDWLGSLSKVWATSRAASHQVCCAIAQVDGKFPLGRAQDEEG